MQALVWCSQTPACSAGVWSVSHIVVIHEAAIIVAEPIKLQYSISLNFWYMTSFYIVASPYSSPNGNSITGWNINYVNRIIITFQPHKWYMWNRPDPWAMSQGLATPDHTGAYRLDIAKRHVSNNTSMKIPIDCTRVNNLLAIRHIKKIYMWRKC